MRSAYIEKNSGKFFQERPTIISDEFATTGTVSLAGVATGAFLKQVSIPAGAYVTKVALLCTAAIGSQDIDVGDGDNDNRYLGAIVSASADDLIIAPHVAGTRVAGGFAGGRYYSSADTIDVTSDITATLADEAAASYHSVKAVGPKALKSLGPAFLTYAG